MSLVQFGPVVDQVLPSVTEVPGVVGVNKGLVRIIDQAKRKSRVDDEHFGDRQLGGQQPNGLYDGFGRVQR